jgi:hypothetical protein
VNDVGSKRYGWDHSVPCPQQPRVRHIVVESVSHGAFEFYNIEDARVPLIIMY